MGRNIDDHADKNTRGIQSVGEQYHDQFLLKRPKTEWSVYIDETAKDVCSGIQIGDLILSKDDFGRELGGYYRRGLKQTAGRYADLPSVLENNVSDNNLGLLAYQLNELSHDITTTDLGIKDVDKATEALIEKLLTRHVGGDLSVSFNISGATVSDITTQLFRNKTIASNIDILLSKFEESASRGLLSLLDEPQMMTPLWGHQRDALQRWWENEHRGYVDMATATGKTVLGLGAIALKYGELHPDDQAIGGLASQSDSAGKDDILIVAHSELILEQWRREFETHLNIPQERTTGSNDITLKWGSIHFRTPQSLVNERQQAGYDLVLLDEAHHYATASEWGSLLDNFDGDILAMSGSVDDAGSDSERIKERLSNSVGPELKRYTISEARADGVIPSFDWEIHYAPYDVVGNELEKVARRSDQAFRDFQTRLTNGEIPVETDRRLRTYEDIRRFSHTKEGTQLKEQDKKFRDLVTRLFSRRTKQWNLSPVLDAVVDLVVEHHTIEKVVVLADSNAQVEELESRLKDVVANPSSVYLVSGSHSQTEQRNIINEFDEPETTGILLGTGDLLGEGVNIPRASVAINMATGGVNQALVQRIGRVLRNPADTPKHAMFYNVVGVPPTDSAAAHREDGKQLIEQAASFCALGRRFETLPGFSMSSSLNGDVLENVLIEGAHFIDTLDSDGEYDWETELVRKDDLEALVDAIRSTVGDVETILGTWEEYAWEHSKNKSKTVGDSPNQDSSTNNGSDRSEDVNGGTALPSEDEAISSTKRKQIKYLVEHQPTDYSDLLFDWDLSSEHEVKEYLRSELAAYHFPDGEQVWASDKAEAFVESMDDSTHGPSSDDLLDEIRRLKKEIGDVPTRAKMTTEGAYSVEQFEQTFGTWSNAVEEAGFTPHGTSKQGYTREQILDGLREIASDLGKVPSTKDVNEHAPFSAAAIYKQFDSIYEARRAAGVDQVEKNGNIETSGQDGVEPNELSEYYELFRNFTSLLERIIEADQTSYRQGGKHPINEWYAEIKDVVFGSGLTDEAPNYGQQQGSRNTHKMKEYRRAYGDGKSITNYQCVSVERLDDRDDLGKWIHQHIAEPNEEIYLPLTPDTELSLPVVVKSEKDLDIAMRRLKQFPAEPTTATDQPGTKKVTVEDQSVFWNRNVEVITKFEVDPNPQASSNGDSLDRKIDEWKSQLLDLTRRNKLVSFKATKTKSLPFEKTDPTTIAAQLAQSKDLYIRKQPDETSTSADRDEQVDLEPNELLPTRSPGDAADSLHSIELNNKQYLRERGVDSLYLSLGMLRWYSTDSSDDADQSPLFLAPVELEEKTLPDGDRHDYVLKSKPEELRLNPALRKKLAAEHGLRLPADQALSLNEIDAAFESVYQQLRGKDRWEIQQDVILGIFDFTKFSLYSDLERNRSKVKNNPIIRALNGDMGPIQRAEGDITTPTADQLDDAIDPIDTYQVLDADSSQQEAIEAAKRGKSFVLQGPPGTGKSQTIANIIAEKLADGERVLFVSEKQAALDVVKDRLDDVGIGRFCLEVHGQKATNVDVLGTLERELKAGQIKPVESRPKQLEKLRERRAEINQYGKQLFFTPDGWDLTAYQAYGIISKHEDVPRIDIGITDPLTIGQETLDNVIDELETLARFDQQIANYETSPWQHTTLRQWGVDTSDAMRRSLDRQIDAIEGLEAVAEQLDQQLGIRPQSLSDFGDAQDLLQHLSNCPEITWQKAFFDGSFTYEDGRIQELASLESERDELIEELTENYQRSFLSANGAELNDELASYGMLKVLKSGYRSLKRKIKNHTQEEYDPDYDQLLEDTRKLAAVQRIEDRREDFRGVIQRLGPLYKGGDTEWERLAQAQDWVRELETYDDTYTQPVINSLLDGTLPDVDPLCQQTKTALKRYEDAAGFFDSAMAVHEMQIHRVPFQQASLSEVTTFLNDLRGEVSHLQQRVQFASQLDTVRETICEDYVDRFLREDYSSEHLVAAFEKRFFTQWLNSVYEHTDLGSFNADTMERYLEDFRRLDQEQQELAKVEVQHEITSRRPSLNLQHAASSEQVLLRREAEKQRRHMPLRELFDEAGSFITQLTPCFMMSPLSVAQYLKSDSIQFDTVVFDEASQIMPQDAVSSLIRAEQAIIAGDTKQLPPTSFFQGDVETTSDVREDLDSILEETAAVLPEKNLRWHYRSRTEELIQFSNYHYYNNSLQTFPENDPDVETGVSFEYVEDGIYDRGNSRQNEVEAQRVVDLIEEHADQHSDKSLGVVAFSSTQEQAIRDAVAQRCEESPVLNAFVSQDDVLDEFFIKNLEMVQGDERDRMIFSVGYGPASDGTISMNFGPLNKSGGERRLNVAVTRAKEQITVVCSMLPGDIDLSGSNSTGAKHFKNYLEYARNGVQALARNDQVTATLDFDSQFEEAVYDALQEEGYDVVSQVQSSSYSIDLAIKHPEHPGKFILGIECDGAAYHSSKTARDRDRTRQMVLEDLGWTIHRIWSPDWASNRQQQIQKINQKVDSLLAGVSHSTSAEDVPTHEPEAVASKSKLDHDGLTEYIEPTLTWNDRYSVDLRGQDAANRNAVEDTIIQNGPIKYDTAMRTYLDVWSQSRAGKRVQRAFDAGVNELKRQNKIYQRGEFLWPHKTNLDFQVRVNSELATRSIDEIPLEELAKAVAILLEEGGMMTRDDVVTETTRLIGYQRRGKRIEERIESAIEALEVVGAVSEESNEKLRLRTDTEVETKLLAGVYQ